MNSTALPDQEQSKSRDASGLPGVIIENLSKSFSTSNGTEISAVRKVSLRIQPGELLAVVGPSGSGKTTLLRMIAGLEEVSEGTISINGRSVTTLPPHEREVSMAFQEHALYPDMTVYENLAFGLKLRKVGKPEIGRRVEEAAQLLGLVSLLDRSPAALSGGERQRVALGRAVIVGAKVLLLDEPLSNLDAPLRAQMRREIVRIHRRLATITIYVTHDQTEALSLADRIVVMQKGMIQQVGSPMDVYHQPANLFVAAFIGAPPMNFVKGALTSDANGVWFHGLAGPGPGIGRLSFKLPAPPAQKMADHAPRSVVAGFRPESIRPLQPAENCAPAETAIEAQVDAIEPFGWETHLVLSLGQHSFVARVVDTYRARTHESIRVALDLSQVRWFDPDSGHALS